MGAIDIQIEQALDKAEEWIEFLATYSDSRLDRKLSLNRAQQVLDCEQENEKAWGLLKIMEEMIILARIYKDENNIPDAPDELEENIKDIETYQLPEIRKEIFLESLTAKTTKKPINIKEKDKDQLNLF